MKAVKFDKTDKLIALRKKKVLTILSKKYIPAYCFFSDDLPISEITEAIAVMAQDDFHTTLPQNRSSYDNFALSALNSLLTSRNNEVQL